MTNNILDISKYNWFFFDLDGTLHDFVFASKQANQKAIHLFSKSYKINYDEAYSSYCEIFRTSQNNYFVDGKPSNENRLNRFKRLIDGYNYSKIGDGFEYVLLQAYNMGFAQNLKPYQHIVNLFYKLQLNNIHIAIVSEGPHDAQEFVIQQLGILPFCKKLITSGKHGISKADGLFEIALRMAEVKSSETLILGDSLDRDVYPAKSLNVDTILVDHHKKHIDIQGISIIHDFYKLINILK